jgi:hypothetical protein
MTLKKGGGGAGANFVSDSKKNLLFSHGYLLAEAYMLERYASRLILQ